MRVERAVVIDRRPAHMVIAIGPSTASTMSARLISVDRPRQREAAAGAAHAGQQAGARRAGPSASARSAAARRFRSASSVALTGARPRRGGRRRSSSRPHNRQGGSGACLIGAFQSDLGRNASRIATLRRCVRAIHASTAPRACRAASVRQQHDVVEGADVVSGAERRLGARRAVPRSSACRPCRRSPGPDRRCSARSP